MGRVNVFVSYDVEHDTDLFEQLREQSRSARFDFDVLGGSERGSDGASASPRVRRRIRDADQMIILCGEHSEGSAAMADELAIAREEGTPYLLLWGRRDLMCTKPGGAKSAEGMYAWTAEILREQITILSRKTGLAAARELARAART